ncbi:MAG: hypothetical protein LBB17_00755 [Puniceicoccales bacterium]|jgi:hypothetical protein|nr:hypothetical protein [Puniceicoccales bacterium]
MVSVKQRTRRKFINSLPLGAKLDYKESVDKLHADVMGKVTASQEKVEEALAQNTKLAKQIRDVLAKQEKVLAILDYKPSEGNPVVKRFKDKLSGIDDLAKLTREHEMRICDTLGLTPKGGWEQALARLEKPAKEGRTMGEISKILLHEEKSEGSSDTDHAKPEKSPESGENISSADVEKNSSDKRKPKTSGSSKRAIKRVRI